MKLGGVFGYTDAGKTTFIEHLSHKETNKYKLQTKKGITLKVGYLSFTTNHNDLVYILDNPGHLSLSIEALRNIDIIDFGIYVLDVSNDFRTQNQKNKLLINHYNNMVCIFKTFNLPFVLILNKIDQCSQENLLCVYRKIKSKATEHIIPTCSLNQEVIEHAKNKISSFVNTLPDTNKKDDHIGIGRVIKSFDVNPVGVELDKIIGGILGVYLFKPITRLEPTLYLSDRHSKGWSKINLVNKKFVQDSAFPKIGTFETNSDPFWFKNDSKKSCFIALQQDTPSYILLESSFSIKLNKKLLNLNKGDELLFIYEGQSFSGIIKKVSKNNIECVRKSSDTAIYKINKQTPTLMFIKNDMKEYLFSGTGILYEET